MSRRRLEYNMSGSDSVTLNCWIVGDDTENIFSVDIEACKNISQLKEKIKHINPEYFSRVDVRCIVLWKVSNHQRIFNFINHCHVAYYRSKSTSMPTLAYFITFGFTMPFKVAANSSRGIE